MKQLIKANCRVFFILSTCLFGVPSLKGAEREIKQITSLLEGTDFYLESAEGLWRYQITSDSSKLKFKFILFDHGIDQAKFLKLIHDELKETDFTLQPHKLYRFQLVSESTESVFPFNLLSEAETNIKKAKEVAAIKDDLEGTDYRLQPGRFSTYEIYSKEADLKFPFHERAEGKKNSTLIRMILAELNGTEFELQKGEFHHYKIQSTSTHLKFYANDLESIYKKAQVLGRIHESLKESGFKLQLGRFSYFSLTSKQLKIKIEFDQLDNCADAAQMIQEIFSLTRDTKIIFSQGSLNRFAIASTTSNIKIEASHLREVLIKLKQLLVIDHALEESDLEITQYGDYSISPFYVLTSQSLDLTETVKSLEEAASRIEELL